MFVVEHLVLITYILGTLSFHYGQIWELNDSKPTFESVYWKSSVSFKTCLKCSLLKISFQYV